MAASRRGQEGPWQGLGWAEGQSCPRRPRGRHCRAATPRALRHLPITRQENKYLCFRYFMQLNLMLTFLQFQGTNY